MTAYVKILDAWIFVVVPNITFDHKVKIAPVWPKSVPEAAKSISDYIFK